MDHTEIKKRIDAMPARMSAKGIIRPEAIVSFNSNSTAHAYLRWSKSHNSHDTNTHFAKAREDIEAALDELDLFIHELPSIEETKTAQFMQALYETIEIGKANGIDVAHVNPLIEQMKTLSKNAITFKPVPFSDDIPF